MTIWRSRMVFHKIIKEYGDLIPVIKETHLDLVHRMEVAEHNETHINTFLERIKASLNEFIKNNNQRKKLIQNMIKELKSMEKNIESDKVVNALEEETKLSDYIKELWKVEESADQSINKVASQILVIKSVDMKTEEEVKLTKMEAEDIAASIHTQLKQMFKY